MIEPFADVLEALKKVSTSYVDASANFFDEAEREWVDEDTDKWHISGLPLITAYFYPKPAGNGEWLIWLEIPEDKPEDAAAEDNPYASPSLLEVFRKSEFAARFKADHTSCGLVNFHLPEDLGLTDVAQIVTRLIMLYGKDMNDVNIEISGIYDKAEYFDKESVVVIPDIHGRKFWREAVEKYPDNWKIFLGDYHDPYPDEGISPEESLENFREILQYVRDNERCTLLLGNHDLHYLCNFGDATRYDYKNAETIKKLFLDNLNLFELFYHIRFYDKSVVFSHAPILKEWLEAIELPDNYVDILRNMGKLLRYIKEDSYMVANFLGHTSRLRCGYDPVGSIVWADMQEIQHSPLADIAGYAIFGHTQVKDAVITDRWANLDCRRAFLLRPDLRIIPITES